MEIYMNMCNPLCEVTFNYLLLQHWGPKMDEEFCCSSFAIFRSQLQAFYSWRLYHCA